MVGVFDHIGDTVEVGKRCREIELAQRSDKFGQPMRRGGHERGEAFAAQNLMGDGQEQATEPKPSRS